MQPFKMGVGTVVTVIASLSASAQIQVPPGFVVDTLLDQIDGTTPRLEAIRNPDYGFGGVLCVDLGDPRRANEFMEILQNKDRFGFMAVSLGYFDTLMSCSSSSTSCEL